MLGLELVRDNEAPLWRLTDDSEEVLLKLKSLPDGASLFRLWLTALLSLLIDALLLFDLGTGLLFLLIEEIDLIVRTGLYSTCM